MIPTLLSFTIGLLISVPFLVKITNLFIMGVS
jgi:hypothetical protein